MTAEATQSEPRVVLVLPTYLPESFGGAEQQARKLALALVRRGVSVTLLAPRRSAATPRHESEGPFEVRRFRVRKSPNLGGRHIGSFVAWSVQLGLWLWRHRREYQVIHVFHGRLHALPAVLAGTWLRKPTLIKIGRGGIEHFDLDILARKRLAGRLYAYLISRYASAYVANSKEIVEDLQRWQVAPSRIHELPNGVDLPPLASTGSRREGVRFLYLGRLDTEKAIDLMIRGFARLAEPSGATLTIVGDGPCRAALEELTAELAVRNMVHFTGVLTDVTQALKCADVFVSTSSSEGMSNALLEAMSFAIMPLVSKVSGVTDIVRDGESGVLFPANDLEAFARRLAEVNAMPPEQREGMGKAARTTVEARFGIEKVAAGHVELYLRLVSQPLALDCVKLE